MVKCDGNIVAFTHTGMGELEKDDCVNIRLATINLASNIIAMNVHIGGCCGVA